MPDTSALAAETEASYVMRRVVQDAVDRPRGLPPRTREEVSDMAASFRREYRESHAISTEPDPVAARLAVIRERSERPLGPHVGALPISSDAVRHLMESAGDVPALLRALGAARAELRKHQQTITDRHGAICAGCLDAVPCPSDAVIAAALLAEDGADGAAGPHRATAECPSCGSPGRQASWPGGLPEGTAHFLCSRCGSGWHAPVVAQTGEKPDAG